ncbi:MAG TPA: BT_3928 family protein [Puia sp.]|nr:BT_3928 family protein [Puia sp.]
MKNTFLNTARLLVGILFIFSGLIKANDPLGLSYKMQEFFEVWNLSALDAWTLGFSIVMIVFEILAGVAVILGWRMRLFAWLLLLLIIFFSFLTGYAVISGKIRECGCFGNCIPLQAMGSFLKDLMLLLLILILFIYRDEIKSRISANGCKLLLALTLIFSFTIQWYTLRYLPIIDCLPFKKGANILEKMKTPANAIPDSTTINFVYEKNHKTIEFSADQMPSDLDSSYTFIKRYDKLIRKGNAEPEIKDFSLISKSGNDSTSQILNRPGYLIMVIARSFPQTNPYWNKTFSLIYTLARSRNIPVIVVTSDREAADAWLNSNDLGMTGETSNGISVFGCDATAVKTAARADPTFYLLKKGTILNKWSYASLELAIPFVAELAPQKTELNPQQ